ncbi:AMP-binding protein, partial [Thermus scotoductus]|uniref:AMP-binding protein n=1 Tax=Thermus scotoductus TaxID=37636 RepID=UPI0020A5E13E
AIRPSYELKRYTLPQLLRLRAEKEGERVALREKDYGIWNEITYAEYYEKVLLFAHGLLSLGFEPGERLAIIADNIPEWLYAELGTQAVRGISVGVYQSSLPAEIAYMLGYTGASIVLAEDQEQVDKLYEIRSEIPKVRHVIYEDPKGMRGYRDPWLLSFEEVLEQGLKHRKKYPDAVEKLLLEASPEEVCHMVKKAEEVLLQIPGVCGLRYGEALSEGAPCFLPPCGAAT